MQHAHCTLNVTDPDCTSLGCFALLGSALVLALLLLAVFQMFLQHAQRGYATARYIIVIFGKLVTTTTPALLSDVGLIESQHM